MRRRCWTCLTPLVSAAPRSTCSRRDRKSTRLNSSHGYISYADFCLEKNGRAHLGLTAVRRAIDKIFQLFGKPVPFGRIERLLFSIRAVQRQEPALGTIVERTTIARN